MGFVAGDSEELTDQQRRSHRIALFMLIPLAVVFVVVLVVFFGVYRPVTVQGPSMEPNLLSADQVLVTRGATSLRDGDVVVLHVNESGVRTELIKRVVATAGQTIQVSDSVATVDGRVESGHAIFRSAGDRAFGPYKVPANTVFVLGDNRPVSNDSRFIGPIPLSSIDGRVVAVFAPINRIRAVHRINAKP